MYLASTLSSVSSRSAATSTSIEWPNAGSTLNAITRAPSFRYWRRSTGTPTPLAGQTWAVRYEVSFYRGQTREGAFALNVEVELLKF